MDASIFHQRPSACRASLRGLEYAQCALRITPARETAYANDASTRQPRRYAYRAMPWVNAAATSVAAETTMLIISAYERDEGKDVAERYTRLHGRLALIDQVVD